MRSLPLNSAAVFVSAFFTCFGRPLTLTLTLPSSPSSTTSFFFISFFSFFSFFSLGAFSATTTTSVSAFFAFFSLGAFTAATKGNGVVWGWTWVSATLDSAPDSTLDSAPDSTPDSALDSTPDSALDSTPDSALGVSISIFFSPFSFRAFFPFFSWGRGRGRGRAANSRAGITHPNNFWVSWSASARLLPIFSKSGPYCTAFFPLGSM